LALLVPATNGTGAVASFAQQTLSAPSAPLIVILAGDPLAGQEPSAARATTHCPPINAFFSASCRRKEAQFRKFPSHSVVPQRELIVALVEDELKRVLVVS
jgi:hypothetical protein